MATGCDYLTGSHNRTVYSITVFATRELAESRIESFKSACLNRLLEAPIKVVVMPLEVISE
jgi:hypothetical protein